MAVTVCVCSTCGREERVNFGECLSKGWPKCCGQTMTLQNATKEDIEKGVAEHPDIVRAKEIRRELQDR
jgi:hypothetical protein